MQPVGTNTTVILLRGIVLTCKANKELKRNQIMTTTQSFDSQNNLQDRTESDVEISFL